MIERNFKEDMAIDKNNLDKECQAQPVLYAIYTELSAHANRKVARAAEKVKTVRSRLILEALSGNVPELGTKPTGPASEAYYRSHADYKAAKDEWLAEVYDAEQYKNALFALNNKKMAIGNLVQLHLNNYYARPETPSADFGPLATEVIAEARKAAGKTEIMKKRSGRRNTATSTEEN